MKLIIIEGPDNCGKDTLIQKILENFPTTTIIHCSKPIFSKHSENEQDTLFKVYLNAILNASYNTSCILMNRGVHGEYVYGTLYRHRSKESVKEMIDTWESTLIESEKKIKVAYIQLLSSNAYLLHKNDDDKSLSSGNSDLIQEELNLFKEIYDNSKLNKKLIYVNDGDKFKSRESIYNEAITFINKTFD